MQHKEYNGWFNYETWVVSLWMDNEQASQHYWHNVAREYAASTVPANKDAATLADTRGLADRLKDEHEVVLPELHGFAADLLNAAMSEVNWYEIAEHLLADEEGA